MERPLVVSTRCETVPIERLDPPLIGEMWRLFDGNYTGVSRRVFERDLSTKQHALILRNGSRIVGFTSQMFHEVDGYRVVYSGDVVVAPDSRDVGTACFFHQWAKSVWRKCDWWCSLSSGPRTFRIPYTFYKRVTPNLDGDEMPEETALRDRFATHAYGKAYDPGSGIVRLSEPYTLRPNEQRIRLNYPMGAYFRAANPGWRRGDELVSLVGLHPENWKPVAMRMLHWKKDDVE